MAVPSDVPDVHGIVNTIVVSVPERSPGSKPFNGRPGTFYLGCLPQNSAGPTGS